MIITKDDILWFYNTRQQNTLPYDEMGQEILRRVRKAHQADLIVLYPEKDYDADEIVQSLVNSSICEIKCGSFVFYQINLYTLIGTAYVVVDAITDGLYETYGDNQIERGISRLEGEIEELMSKIGLIQEKIDIIENRWNKYVKKSGVEGQEESGD